MPRDTCAWHGPIAALHTRTAIAEKGSFPSCAYRVLSGLHGPQGVRLCVQHTEGDVSCVHTQEFSKWSCSAGSQRLRKMSGHRAAPSELHPAHNWLRSARRNCMPQSASGWRACTYDCCCAPNAPPKLEALSMSDSPSRRALVNPGTCARTSRIFSCTPRSRRDTSSLLQCSQASPGWDRRAWR